MSEAPLPSTLGMALLDHAVRRPDAIALIFPDRRLTYAQLADRARARARALHATGLAHGDTLGLAMEDGAEFLFLLLGAALCGITTVIFARGVRASVLAPRLPFLDTKLFIASGDEGRLFLSMLPEAHALIGHPPVPAMHVDDDAFANMIGNGAASEWDADASAGKVSPDDDALVVFTSGMTGMPKTCPATHWNVMSKAAPFVARFEMRQDSRLWIGVPMFQVGFIAPFFAAMAAGATLIVPAGLDAAGVRGLLANEQVTHAYPIYLGNWLPIVNAPSFRPSQFPDLSHICLTGPMTALRRAQRALPQAVVMNTYGGAETAGGLCLPRSEDPAAVRLGSSGRPLTGNEARIVDPETTAILNIGGVGEIQLRGPGIPVARPGNTFGPLFTADGWLHTSDLGTIDRAGTITFRGRLSETLAIAGESVSALDIEAVLMLHRAVAVAQVIARPDIELGEAAAAFVELRSDGGVSAEELLAFCAEHLPATHVPRYLRFMSEWPTSSSKIYKPSLTDMPVGPKIRPAAAI